MKASQLFSTFTLSALRLVRSRSPSACFLFISITPKEVELSCAPGQGKGECILCELEELVHHLVPVGSHIKPRTASLTRAAFIFVNYEVEGHFSLRRPDNLHLCRSRHIWSFPQSAPKDVFQAWGVAPHQVFDTVDDNRWCVPQRFFKEALVWPWECTNNCPLISCFEKNAFSCNYHRCSTRVE